MLYIFCNSFLRELQEFQKICDLDDQELSMNSLPTEQEVSLRLGTSDRFTVADAILNIQRLFFFFFLFLGVLLLIY